MNAEGKQLFSAYNQLITASQDFFIIIIEVHRKDAVLGKNDVIWGRGFQLIMTSWLATGNKCMMKCLQSWILTSVQRNLKGIDYLNVLIYSDISSKTEEFQDKTILFGVGIRVPADDH